MSHFNAMKLKFYLICYKLHMIFVYRRVTPLILNMSVVGDARRKKAKCAYSTKRKLGTLNMNRSGLCINTSCKYFFLVVCVKKLELSCLCEMLSKFCRMIGVVNFHHSANKFYMYTTVHQNVLLTVPDRKTVSTDHHHCIIAGEPLTGALPLPQAAILIIVIIIKKGKGVCIAIYGNPSHNYGVSLAVWNHTV